MKEIGGYFGLEIAAGTLRYKDAVAVNSGRAGLELIVRSRGFRKVWLPDYICPVVPERLEKMGVAYGWYKINEDLEPARIPRLMKDEAFLYVNYFGIKDAYCRDLEFKFRSSNLILDLTQAYYYRPKMAYGFNSTRKFFGVPDGGFAFGKGLSADSLPASHSYDQCEALLRRADGDIAGGYAAFQRLDEEKGNMSAAKMSLLTRQLLQSADTSAAQRRRQANFRILHKNLAASNRLFACELNTTTPSITSLVYPYLTKNGVALRRKLIDNEVFCPTYWPDLVRAGSTALRLTRDLVCIPCDQRYGREDMRHVAEVING